MNLAPTVAPAAFVSGKIVPVTFEDASSPNYDIVIGQNNLSEIATLVRVRLGVRRCFIVTDGHVDELYRARLEARLIEGGHAVLGTCVLPPGEENKNFQQLQSLLSKILSTGADRQTLVIALGGGVVGDMAGLAASLALRGLDYIQIPTTLLAQVDSSVGGKTAIDTEYGKNTVGSFYQPRLVLADVSLLDSLSEREMRAGYAEVVKYGLISDPSFFRWCVAHGGQLLHGDREAQVSAVATSCAAKAQIVAEDEHEKGSRALLNLGHTFGHALETATGYGNLLVHGEAVALGILLAFRLSVRMGLCASQDYDEIKNHFAITGLPVSLPPFAYDVDQLVALMAQDKKAEAGKITLILAQGIGRAFVARDCDQDVIRALWKEALPQR